MQVAINQSDLAKINFMLGSLGKNAAVVMSRSVNKTIDGVKTDIKAVVRSTNNFKLKDIEKQISAKKTFVSGTNMSEGRVAVGGNSFYGRGKGTAVIGVVGARKITKGISIQINVDGARKLIPGAFKATMKSGHVGIFRREKYSRLRDRKTPIKELFTTSVPDAISDDKAFDQVRENAKKRLDINIAAQFKYVLGVL